MHAFVSMFYRLLALLACLSMVATFSTVSLGVLARRIVVSDEDNREARRVLIDAGLAHELRPDD